MISHVITYGTMCASAVGLSLVCTSNVLGGPCDGTTDLAEGSQAIESGQSALCYGENTFAQHFGRMHDLSQGALAGTEVEIHCVTLGIEFAQNDFIFAWKRVQLHF